ncbi:MAG: helix-turn-helix domain-containing protein [Anaerolineales bacterium]|nr:helix-turn-helix domain-containing protein [Anaerolineales bacterium]
MNDQNPGTVMTVPEVAAYLKLANSTIYRLAKAGNLPGRKVGGAWRFSRVEIEGWLCERPLVDETQIAENKPQVL